MTTSDANIETLQTQVDKIKTDLDALKKETSEKTKKTKEETLEKSVTTTKEAINKKLEELKTLWEETYKSDIDKLKAMLVTLWGSADELTTLKTSITKDKDATTSDDITKTDDKKDEKPEEKKNRFKRQIDGFTDSTEEHHAWKNTARIMWWVGIIALGIRGIKKIFNLGKKDKETDDTKTDDTKDKTPDDTKKVDNKTDDVTSKVSKKVEDKASGRFDKMLKKIWL